MGQTVSAKGTKGLLQWLKASQPDFYAYLSPKLIAYAKGQTLQGLSCMPPSKMGRMGDLYSSYTSSYSSSATPSYTSSLTPFSTPVTATAPSDLNIASASSDAATIASTSPTSNSLASAISAIANGYSSATLTAAQISANNTLLQTNLARAQQGLPPLTAAGITGSGLTSNSGLLLLGVAAAAAFLLSKGQSSK
jgi:hypothetical protein